jgi:hypothetical protein
MVAIVELVFEYLNLIENICVRALNKENWLITGCFLIKLRQVKDRWVHESRIQYRSQKSLDLSDYPFRSENPNDAEPNKVLEYLVSLGLKLSVEADAAISNLLVI